MLNVCALGDGHGDRPAVAQSLVRWLRTQGSLDMNQLPIRVAAADFATNPWTRPDWTTPRP
jgi:hypothetical protein